MNTQGTPTSPASAEPAQFPTGAFFPLVSLRRHWKVGLAVMALILLAGLPFAWIKGNKFTYSVTATIYVAPRFINILQDPKDLELPSFQQFRQFIQHQALTVGRFDILQEALERMGERRKVWQLPNETLRQATERLQSSLKVVAVKESYLITVNLESSSKDGLDELVNMVVNTFMDKVKLEEIFYARDARLGSLRERREAILKSVEEKTAERTKIAQSLGVTIFSDSGPNPFDQVLVDGQTNLAIAQRNRIAAESSLLVFEDPKGRPIQQALEAASFDDVAKDPGLASLKANAYQRRDSLLAQTSGLEETHPLKSKLDRQLSDLTQQVAKAIQDETDKVGKALLEQRRAELNRTRRIEQEINHQIETHRQKAAWFANLYNQGLSLNSEIERDRKQLEAIENRMDYFELESRAPGFIRAESYARPPEQPVSGGRKKLLMVVSIAAIALGLLLPIAIDMSDRTIKTTGQVRKILGYPPLAGLLEPSDDLQVRRVIADQRRRLTVALERERTLRDCRVLMLTSVKPGAGVSGLAFALAAEFAELGVKAIVVETNAFKPDPRYISHALQTGLLDLLSGEGDLDAAITPASGLLPDRIGVGLPMNPHLFGYHQLREIIAKLQNRYAVVLLDAPPISLSADTEYLAGMADLSLLLVGAGQVQPGELRRAVDILQKINPPAVSFIVTHLQIYQGGGYFADLVRQYHTAETEAAQIIRDHPINRPPA